MTMSMSFAQAYPNSRSPLTVNRSVTHPSLHIRDARDAHILLEAVRLNILPLIKRRLVASEREQLTSGNVFVWEEAEDEGGLLRWTDGRRWSQSRMRGDYLFYEEKIETTQEERDAKAARRARRASDPTAIVPPPTRRKDRPAKPNGLTKQTYSALVNLPGSPSTRKWHVVAYFAGNDYTNLPVIESYDYLRRIRVPEGIFLSSKTLTSRIERFSYYSDETDSMDHDHPSSRSNAYSETSAGSISHSVVTSASSSPVLHSVTQSYTHNTYSPPMHSALVPPQTGGLLGGSVMGQKVMLPPLSSLGHQSRPHPSRSNSYGTPSVNRAYTPLSVEDRRVLERFRISL